MALFDLNRSNDTPISTLKVAEIAPKNWHRFPAVQPASPRIYVPVFTYNGGAVGDDVDVATSNVLVDDRGIGAYVPRHQAQKATLPGAPPESVPIDPTEVHPDYVLAVDVARPRGWIAMWQPYIGNASPAVAPVITSLAPNTAVAVTGAELVVTITGTGFTPWSSVTSGGYPIPSKYVDATHLTIYQNPKVAVAGTVQVVVIDHDMNSAPSNFVFT